MNTNNDNWLSPEDAIGAVEAARKAGAPLYGFDGAFLRGNVTQLSLDDSWDYSGGSYPTVADPYAHAIQFIQDRAEKGLHFEIVLGPLDSNYDMTRPVARLTRLT